MSEWSWGKSTVDIVLAKLYESMIIKKNHTVVFRRGKESSSKEIVCFDDLYLSTRNSHWIEGIDNTILLRKEMAMKKGEPAAAAITSERPILYSGTASSYQEYCTPGVLNLVCIMFVPPIPALGMH